MQCHNCGFRIVLAKSTSGKWISLDDKMRQPKKGEWYYDDVKLRMIKAIRNMKKYCYMNHVCDKALKLNAFSNGKVKVIKKDGIIQNTITNPAK